MKIRVLHVIDHLGYGGAPFVVKNIVERMPADRIESCVCALRPNPKALSIDAEVVTLKSRKYSVAAVRAVVDLCVSRRIDIVHAHLQKAILVTLLARPCLKSRLILHEHGPIFRGGTGCLYRLMLRRLGPRADAVVANSKAAKSAVQAAMRRDIKIHVIGNYIDMSRFDPGAYDRDIARRSLGLGADEFVVGFVGRLDRAKGADLLLDAAGTLKGTNRVIRFVIVGDGPERKRLVEQSRKLGLERMVVFAGLRENTAAVMRAFDAAVVPSRREAFGIAALELMRMAVPVIVSPVGGLPELVRDGQTGLVLWCLGPSAIAQCILRLESDGALREGLARNGREHAAAFDGSREVQQIVEIYERLSS